MTAMHSTIRSTSADEFVTLRKAETRTWTARRASAVDRSPSRCGSHPAAQVIEGPVPHKCSKFAFATSSSLVQTSGENVSLRWGGIAVALMAVLLPWHRCHVSGRVAVLRVAPAGSERCNPFRAFKRRTSFHP